MKHQTSKKNSQSRIVSLFLSFFLVLSGLGIFLLHEITTHMAFIDQERQGVAIISKILPLLIYIPEHRGLCTTYLKGDKNMLARCLQTRKDVDTAFEKLDRSLFEKFGIEDKADILKKSWDQLKESTLELSATKAFTEHTRLVHQLIHIIEALVRKSNLILDPKLTTHSMINIVIQGLPSLAEDIGQIRGLGSSSIAKGHINKQIHLELSRLVARTDYHKHQLHHLLEYLQKEESTLNNKIELLAQKTLAQTDAFIERFVTPLLHAEILTEPAEVFFAMGSKPIASIYQLYDETLLRLDALLKARQAQYRLKLLLTFLALIILTLFLAYLYRRLSNSMMSLQEGEASLRSIFETAVDGIIAIDIKGQILDFSPAAEHIFGYKKDEVLNQNVKMLMPEPDQSAHDQYITNYLTGGKPKVIGKQLEVIGLHKSGKPFPMELAVAEAFNGKEIFFTGIIRDITERKQTEKFLLEAKNTAECANKAKSVFLSSMSHELRTPMNAILGFSQILSMNIDKNLTDLQQSNINEINIAGHHLLNLINEILDLSKIESDQFVLSMDTIVLSDIMWDALHLIRPLAEKREISIKLVNNGKVVKEDMGCTPILLTGDYTRFKQIMINLLSNAVKYNKQNGDIVITCEKFVENKQLRIQISDTGKGLSKEQQSQLFKPFERLGADTTDIEGTGIGLVITKKLVELMNGRIGVESVQNEGSNFWLEFPYIDGQTTSEQDDKSDEVMSINEIHTLNDQNYSVLYIEDNVTNLLLVQQALENIPNMIFLDASEALPGIELAIKHQPDLILMDINLPDLNGFKALNKLQKNERTAHIPVIAISANAMAKDIEEGQNAGFKEYITKPIDVKKLLKIVASNLSHS